MRTIVQDGVELKIVDRYFFDTELFLLETSNNDLIKKGRIYFGFFSDDLEEWCTQILVPTWTRSDKDDDFVIYDSVVEYLLCNITDLKENSGNPDRPFLYIATFLETIPVSEVTIIPDKNKDEDYELGMYDTAYLNKKRLIVKG
jgi:hypothetical protein